MLDEESEKRTKALATNLSDVLNLHVKDITSQKDFVDIVFNVFALLISTIISNNFEKQEKIVELLNDNIKSYLEQLKKNKH